MKKRSCRSRFRELFNEVSTPPNKTSFYWKDSFSMLSWLILNTLYIARFFSLLQWVKHFIRKEKKKDDESKRPNVPSIVVELYYVILSAVFVCLALWNDHITSCWNVLIRIVSVYFLVDSLIWVLYYFFFRRFFEEKYAIMHTLEYIVTFPFVIILQACCLKICAGIGVMNAASMLINPEFGTPLPILAISVIYTAVILGLIISNLPTENIKEKGDYRYHLLVIGYGEVVKGRLLDAIYENAKKEEDYKNVIFYDKSTKQLKDKFKDDKPSNLDLHKYQIKYWDKDEMELMHKRILASNILWIATPPFAHLRYVESYYNKLKMIVVEKPITVFRNELDIFRMIHSSHNNIFCLSYYYLEKALPLTYLYRPLEFYEEYLSITNKNRSDIITSFQKLGKPESISLYIHEGTEKRSWCYDEQTGGQLFETFIHLLVITRLVLGAPMPLHCLSWKNEEDSTGNITHITATGNLSGVDTTLDLQKELPDSKTKDRGGEIVYKNGKIIVDFEKMNLTMYSGQDKYSIEMSDDYIESKYSIQLDMVNRCLKDHINPSTIDGSDLQIECLEWLMDERHF
jgi:predicted dehydrogenase